MEIKLEPLAEKHRTGVVDIYNHYVDNGFACYRERRVPYGAFDHFLGRAKGYPAFVSLGEDGAVSGFGFLHAWHPAECFARTAEVTYFLHPDAMRRGIGSLFLRRFEEAAAAMGIDRLLASISSRNPESLAFHRQHGFAECGRFPEIGRKRGTDFDVVWMVKRL